MQAEVKKRNSSFELLRIILILMVILGHANIWFLDHNEFGTDLEYYIRMTVETMCLPAVNGFVLISGWFGIKGNIKRFFSLLFQLFFFTVPISLFFFLRGEISLFSLDGIREYFFGGNQYWFIIDYLGLFLFAPILNIVFENTPKKMLMSFLIGTYLFIVIFDVILRSTVLGIEGGYSLLWFIFLYMLARYLRVYGCDVLEKHKLSIFLSCLLLQAVLLFFHLIGNRYTNPFVLLPAISMLIFFKNHNFTNKLINYIAPGTLMAYMIHMHPCYTQDLMVFLRGLYSEYGYYMYMVEVLGLIILLYISAVLLNKIQAYLWSLISKKI